jgi:hypothetical protein
VNQHRPVLLVEDIPVNLDDVIRRDPDHVPVESDVVKCTQRDTVPERRDTVRIRVQHDVGRVEELLATKPTDRAVMLMCPHHAIAELRLVQALLSPAM